MLLGEIPRATSAPPHFDDHQRALASPLSPGKTRLGVSHSDPLLFPDAFLHKRLPVSLSDSCVSDLQHSGHPLPDPLFCQQILHRSQQALRQPPLQQQHLQAFESRRELNGQGNQFPQQFPYDDESIRSTFANLSLLSNRDPRQLLPDNGNGYTTCGNLVPAPEGFLVESSVRSTTRTLSPTNEPFENGSSFPLGDEPSSAHNLQKITRQQGLDWNSTLQATRMDRPSMAFFQAQQSPFVDFDLPHPSQPEILPLATSRQSVRRSLRESDLHGNGFQADVVPEELQHDRHAFARIQEEKLHLAQQVAADRHQQQYQQRLLQRQQFLEQQSALYTSLHNQVGDPRGLFRCSEYLPTFTVPGIPRQWSYEQSQAGDVAGWSHPDTSCMMGWAEHGDFCRLYPHGHGAQGNAAPYSLKDGSAGAVCGQDGRLGTFFPNKNLHRRSLQNNGNQVTFAGTAGRRRKDVVENGHLAANGDSLPAVAEKHDVQQFLVLHHEKTHSSQQLMKFTTLEEVEGRIYNVAKDQHGCRFLQRKFDEGKPEDVKKIFEEIEGHIVELMTDPFGNYLVQKFLEVCHEAQRMEILEAVTKNDDLVTISLNMHGTRAVQKLIETLRTPEQVSMVMLSLKQGVVTLIKDLNGNHVVQRCLQRLSNQDSQFIFDAAASHCMEIASHRHGCCVLQRCVDFASGVQRHYLVAEIAANALTLSQDPFGNYVVQYILELGLPWASVEVMARLEGSFAHLAMQKFSSNVVEKCLKLATDDNKVCIVKELIARSVLGQLLQDPYANYVIQSALQVTKGPLHTNLVDAIRPHVPILRSSPYGRRILSRTHLKK